MPYDTAMEYYEAMHVIEAQQTLLFMQINDYSNGMTKSGRRDLFRNIKKVAYPRGMQKQITTDELKERLFGG